MPELDSWSRAAAAAADALPLAAAGAAGGGDAVIAAAQREATPLTAEPRLKAIVRLLSAAFRPWSAFVYRLWKWNQPVHRQAAASVQTA